MLNEKAGAPAYVLMASGGLAILYSLIYLAWTLLPVAWGIFGVVAQITEGGGLGDAFFAGILLLLVPILQLLGFVITLILGAVALLGGVRLNNWQSKGVVMLGAVASVAGPLFALVVNAGSALGVGSCGMGCITGCLLGNIPTVILLIVGVVASIMVGMTITKPEVVARFEGQL